MRDAPLNPAIDERSEWLEADGLGGFASGTTSGIATRRYHALLLAAQSPPSRRFVLVNGFRAWLETPQGAVQLTRHHFAPDVVTEADARRRLYGPKVDTELRKAFLNEVSLDMTRPH